jgi:hypothetical protein
MAKLTNVRERVHQPFRDTLIRTSGMYQGVLNDRADLFTQAGKTDGETNLKNGSTLPSDQSMVVLALRVFVWFRAPFQKTYAGDDKVIVTQNGDWSFGNPASDFQLLNLLNSGGTSIGSIQDVYRLYWQAEEQLLWSFGTGDKYSLSSMPTAYFPYGGGLHGDMGGATDLIHWNNGMPDHAGILRLARAILLPPRQNIKCSAQIVSLPDGGNYGTFNGQPVNAPSYVRNTLSLTANLNAIDAVQKVISFTFDGLFSRDVQ